VLRLQGTVQADGEAAVQRVADRFGAPDVQTNQEFADSIAGEIDQYLTVVYVLLILAVVIALMGIATTLSLPIHERTRELGVLRAVGQTRCQTRTMVRGEALTVALFGTAGGVGLGLFLGWAACLPPPGRPPVRPHERSVRHRHRVIGG
jgi:putative ABC transport system permease protein